MICGVDEAGRGCLAGPLVIAACTLHESLDEINDSKQLSEKKREVLYEKIIKISSYKIFLYSHEDIDQKGLSWCFQDALKKIKIVFDKHKIIFDGNTAFGVSDIKTLIKADSLIKEVGAASILAKVSRDRYMYQMDKLYPLYFFSKHKGYGSKLHVEKIKNLGPSPIQRKSFIIKSLQNPSLFD